MTRTNDFTVVNVPAMLSVKVGSYDASGTWIADRHWNHRSALRLFVFAELLESEGLLAMPVDASPRDDLIIRWSDLTPRGQEFVKLHFDKWLRSVDRTDAVEETMRKKLAKRWQSFLTSSQSK